MYLFFISMTIVVAITVYQLMRYYASPRVNIYEKIDIYLAWFLCMAICALVPLDVTVTLNNEPRGPLPILWAIPYWASQILSYLIIPLHQVYSAAGDFTVWARIKTSLRENATLYGIIGIAGAFGLFILIVTEGVDIMSLSGMAVALSQTFALSSGMLLMGYGMVDIPRNCWRKAGLTSRLRWCEQRVAKVSEKLDRAHTELAKMVWFAETVSSTMPRRHRLRYAVDIIDDLCKQSAVSAQQPDREVAAEEDYDFEDIHALALLRRRLKRALGAYERYKHEYYLIVYEAIETEDILLSRATGKSTGDRRFRSTLNAPRTGPRAALYDQIEWWWKCIIRPAWLKVLSVLMAVLTIVTVFAEATMWVSKVNKNDARELSIVSLIIESFPEGSEGDFPIKVTVGILLFYMCNSAFYSIFRLGMFEQIFHVVPHSTDAVSLLFCGVQFCRYAPALCYNCLNLLPIVHRNGTKSVFEIQMNQNLPEFAKNFMLIFPCILPFYCTCIVFGLFEKMFRCCGSSDRGKKAGKLLQFKSDSDGDSDEHQSAGKTLLTREKETVRNGLPIGDNHPSYSGRMGARARSQGVLGSAVELNRWFKRGDKNAAGNASRDGLEKKNLLDDHGESSHHHDAPGPSGAAGKTREALLKEKLHAKAEAVKAGGGATGPRKTGSVGESLMSWGQGNHGGSASGGAGTSAAAHGVGGAGKGGAKPAPMSTLDSVFSSLGGGDAGGGAGGGGRGGGAAATGGAGAGAAAGKVKYPWS